MNSIRVAYWPNPVDCNNICVKVSYGGRTLHLLHVDTSTANYDISYDAWNYLVSGNSAVSDPRTGGSFLMETEYVSPTECHHLLDSGQLPLSAANSMAYLVPCLGQSDSWVANHHQLFNIYDSSCKYGWDEICTLDLAVSNQACCPHVLGSQDELSGLSVTNIAYGTGEIVPA